MSEKPLVPDKKNPLSVKDVAFIAALQAGSGLSGCQIPPSPEQAWHQIEQENAGREVKTEPGTITTIVHDGPYQRRVYYMAGRVLAVRYEATGTHMVHVSVSIGTGKMIHYARYLPDQQTPIFPLYVGQSVQATHHVGSVLEPNALPTP